MVEAPREPRHLHHAAGAARGPGMNESDEDRDLIRRARVARASRRDRPECSDSPDGSHRWVYRVCTYCGEGKDAGSDE
jgi:hypothetical protein